MTLNKVERSVVLISRSGLISGMMTSSETGTNLLPAYIEYKDRAGADRSKATGIWPRDDWLGERRTEGKQRAR